MARLSPLIFGFLLLLVCVVRLDALKTPRGVRGSRSGLISERDLKENNNSKNKNSDEQEDKEQIVEQAKEETTAPTEEDTTVEPTAEETTEAPKENDKNDKEDETPEPEDEETPEPEEEETPEPTPAPVEEETPAPVEKETPAPVEEETPEDEETEEPEAPAPQDEDTEPEDTEPEDEDPAEDTTTDAPETDTPLLTDAPEIIETDAPEIVETDAPVLENNETVTNATDIHTMNLAPFTIEVVYEGNISEDPGIEQYLYDEMIAAGVENLEEISLELTVDTVDTAARRKLATSQVLYYNGTATFDGPTEYGEEELVSLQTNILSDEEAVSTVMAISLGEDPANFTVTSIEVEETAVPSTTVPDGATGESEPADDDELSTYGMVIVIVAACIGALALAIICFVAMREPKIDNSKPYGAVSQSLVVESPAAASTKDEKTKEEPKEDLNKTFDAEDEVHEEFAQNMEDHSFGGSWNKKDGPVKMQASVGRGSFSVSEADDKSAVSNVTNPDELKNELANQLSELQASVQSAREKTQKLLDESKASLPPPE